MHSEILFRKNIFRFLRPIVSSTSTSLLLYWRCVSAWVTISAICLNRLWIVKCGSCYVLIFHTNSRKSLSILLSFAALLILFIVPLSKSSLWTLSIRFISLHWLVMRFKDGTAYAALYMLIMYIVCIYAKSHVSMINGFKLFVKI